MHSSLLPTRYYSHLLDTTDYADVLNQLELENSRSQFPAAAAKLVQLLDTVALHTVLGMCATAQERATFLSQYTALFRSPKLLDKLPNSQKVLPLLTEQLQRTMASLL